MKIEISKPLASNGHAESFDVVQLKKALNRLGYYMPHEDIGITDIPDQRMFDALKSFQRMNGLRPTGQLRPDDETATAINAALADAPNSYYIWRIVEDGKARAAHAQYNRTIRSWNASPDPGEDFNCRCWAEEIPKQEGIFLPMKGLKVPQSDYDPENSNFPDAINSTISPLDLLGGLLFKGGLQISTKTLLLTTTILRRSPKLNVEQTKSLARFIKKVPSNSKATVEVTGKTNGNVKFTAVSKGKVPGSKAQYEKTVDSQGNTIKYIKTTYGKRGEKIHTKNKLNKGDGQ